METRVRIIAITETDWNTMVATQMELLMLLKEFRQITAVSPTAITYMTAMEFMQAVKIKRTKFDQLVSQNRIKTIKKDRKIYVPSSEVEKYFKAV